MSNFKSIQTKIESARDGKEINEILELNLDDCETDGEVVGIDEEFSSLKTLSIVNAKLTSLKGFPKLLKLQKLDLGGNFIDGSLSSLSNCISLSCLNLSGNKIDNIEALSPLADLKHLTSLNLCNCEIAKIPEYREKVYKLIPSLKVLDGINQEGNVENGENGVGDVKKIKVVNEKEAEDEESDVEEESDESDDDDEYGLSYLARDDIVDDDDEDGDYEEEEDEDDEEIEDEGDNDNERGVKRKHDDDDDESS